MVFTNEDTVLSPWGSFCVLASPNKVPTPHKLNCETLYISEIVDKF